MNHENASQYLCVPSKIRNPVQNVNREMPAGRVTHRTDSAGGKVMRSSRRRIPGDTLYCQHLFLEPCFLLHLIIRSSDIHAAGCFTLERIPKGTRVLEYTGERITKAEGDNRYEGRPFTYLFGVGDGEVIIDGHGMAMFVNHSCDPNCETDEEGDRVYIITLRDVAAGEELTYDYWLYDGDDDAPCYCGSKTCRGSMYSPEELKKQARAKAKKKKKQTGQKAKKSSPQPA
jgi:uncharacterized protein